MQLYTLLKDRASINILKILYDNEKNKSYSMRLSDIQQKLAAPLSQFTIKNLKDAGLLTIDHQPEENITIIAITKKGKSFIGQFDRLIDAFNGIEKKKRAYQVKYDLTDLEQRILIMTRKMISETGKPITITTLTQEVYPYQEPAKKRNTVSKYVKRLADINLLKKTSKNNKTFIDMTPSGERTIKEQFMEIKNIKKN